MWRARGRDIPRARIAVQYRIRSMRKGTSATQCPRPHCAVPSMGGVREPRVPRSFPISASGRAMACSVLYLFRHTTRVSGAGQFVNYLFGLHFISEKLFSRFILLQICKNVNDCSLYVMRGPGRSSRAHRLLRSQYFGSREDRRGGGAGNIGFPR